jgi:peptidoglycan hydrolase-like protein with peptidoglycan-binding domain
VPDRIEVIEHGTPPVELARYLNPPLPRNTTATSNIEPDPGSSARRRNVNIESARVMQIQQALTNQGFYGGEISGNYDAETVEAMRRFQISERIAATGYPTAHALKRLGLTNW